MRRLRPYQAEAVERVRAEMRAGRKRVVCCLPTGAGKTVIGADVCRKAVLLAKSVLWLAHRRELVDQTCRTFADLGLDVGAIAADSSFPARPEAPVQVASIQTLVARNVRPPADLIVWDEAHHCAKVAREWTKLLESYPEVHVLGLTATPERGDGTGLRGLFDALVVGATIKQLTDAGHLVPAEVVRPAGRLESDELAQDPVDAYCEHASGQQGFIFSRFVEQSKDAAERLRARGVSAECITGNTPADVRREAIDRFRAGLVRVLCNVFVFTEGTDLPAASVCVLARGAGSAGVYLQMIGRVLRPAPGKSRALIIDLQGVSHAHGMPDDLRVWSLDGKACQLAGKEGSALSMCPRCGAPLDDEEPYPCEACEYEPDHAVRITGEELKFARKRAENVEERWATMLRWAAVAADNGFKPGWLYHKFKCVYGEPPPDGWTFKALRIARGDKTVGA